MATDIEQEFIDAQLGSDSPFRESISYTVSGGSPKTIYGIVRRAGIGRTSGRGDSTPATYDTELIISSDATAGIANVLKDEDVVSITSPEFNEANVYTVAGIIARTAMAWHLGLKA